MSLSSFIPIQNSSQQNFDSLYWLKDQQTTIDFSKMSEFLSHVKIIGPKEWNKEESKESPSLSFPINNLPSFEALYNAYSEIYSLATDEQKESLGERPLTLLILPKELHARTSLISKVINQASQLYKNASTYTLSDKAEIFLISDFSTTTEKVDSLQSVILETLSLENDFNKCESLLWALSRYFFKANKFPIFKINFDKLDELIRAYNQSEKSKESGLLKIFKKFKMSLYIKTDKNTKIEITRPETYSHEFHESEKNKCVVYAAFAHDDYRTEGDSSNDTQFTSENNDGNENPPSSVLINSKKRKFEETITHEENLSEDDIEENLKDGLKNSNNSSSEDSGSTTEICNEEDTIPEKTALQIRRNENSTSFVTPNPSPKDGTDSTGEE